MEDLDDTEASTELIATTIGRSRQRALQVLARAEAEFKRTWELLEYVVSVDIETASPVELSNVIRACRELQTRLVDGRHSDRARLAACQGLH
jgi:hypothetical protein